MFRRLHLTTLALLAAGAAGCGDRADPGPTEPASYRQAPELPAARAPSRRRADPQARRPARHRSGSRAGWRWLSRSPDSGPTSRTRSTARPSASTSFTSSTSSAAPAAGPAPPSPRAPAKGSRPSIPTRARPSRSRCICPWPPIARPGAAARTSWWPRHGTTARPGGLRHTGPAATARRAHASGHASARRRARGGRLQRRQHRLDAARGRGRGRRGRRGRGEQTPTPTPPAGLYMT